MKINPLHSWQLSPKEAIALQKELSKKLVFCPFTSKAQYIAGVDVSFTKNNPMLYAAVVVIRLPEMETVEIASIALRETFPYIPGLLSFRELPALCKAFEKLRNRPDVILCDGHGIAHPRGIGIASHLGLLVNVPTIGCAKQRLTGKYLDPDRLQWAQSPLMHKEKQIGMVVRTKTGVKPMFISPGHLIDLPSALRIVKQCTSRYRLPEPTRKAHIAVNEARRKDLATFLSDPA